MWVESLPEFFHATCWSEPATTLDLNRNDIRASSHNEVDLQYSITPVVRLSCRASRVHQVSPDCRLNYLAPESSISHSLLEAVPSAGCQECSVEDIEFRAARPSYSRVTRVTIKAYNETYFRQ